VIFVPTVLVCFFLYLTSLIVPTLNRLHWQGTLKFDFDLTCILWLRVEIRHGDVTFVMWYSSAHLMQHSCQEQPPGRLSPSETHETHEYHTLAVTGNVVDTC